MISDAQRAGHALRAKAPKLVDAVVSEQYRRMPHLLGRYGEAGRAFCVRDVGYHLRFLAASVELADPSRFLAYVTWARALLLAHGIPERDLIVTLDAMRQAIAAQLAPGVAAVACRHIDAAVAACDASSVAAAMQPSDAATLQAGHSGTV